MDFRIQLYNYLPQNGAGHEGTGLRHALHQCRLQFCINDVADFRIQLYNYLPQDGARHEGAGLRHALHQCRLQYVLMMSRISGSSCTIIYRKMAPVMKGVGLHHALYHCRLQYVLKILRIPGDNHLPQNGAGHEGLGYAMLSINVVFNMH
jgi:hypothetical protein